MVINDKAKNKLLIIKDNIHSDYVFESKIWKNLFKTNKRYVCIGWGNKSIYCDINEWKEISEENIIEAFFGTSETVVHVYFLDELPVDKQVKKINIDDDQLEILKNHIIESFKDFYIIKNNESGYFYYSLLKYNFINTCNNWLNKGLLKCRLSSKFWCPISFWVAHEQQFQTVKNVDP